MGVSGKFRHGTSSRTFPSGQSSACKHPAGLDVAEVWRRDDNWGFALICFSTLGCLYFGWKWRREGKADSTTG